VPHPHQYNSLGNAGSYSDQPRATDLVATGHDQDDEGLSLDWHEHRAWWQVTSGLVSSPTTMTPRGTRGLGH
jgi:hypothetical protein